MYLPTRQARDLRCTYDTVFFLSFLLFRICGHLAHYKEGDFSKSYQFILNLFSFLLRVDVSLIHEEVCLIEHKLFSARLHKSKKKSKPKKVEIPKGPGNTG